MKLKLLANAVALVMLVGCSKSDQVGKVGDTNIEKPQFEAYLKLKNIPVEDVNRADAALDNLLEREALATAIEKTESLDSAVIDAELQEFRRQMLISRYFEAYLKESVSDVAIQNFYSANTEKYQSSKVHVAHMLFRVNAAMDETERQAVMTRAHEAYSKLQAQADFSELALNSSEDKVSAMKGGDLGWVAEGAIAPEFSERAFALTPGEYSEPFLTAFGFHIIKVLEAPQVITKPLEAVKGDIRYQLRNQAKAAETERLKATVTVKKGA